MYGVTKNGGDVFGFGFDWQCDKHLRFGFVGTSGLYEEEVSSESLEFCRKGRDACLSGMFEAEKV